MFLDPVCMRVYSLSKLWKIFRKTSGVVSTGNLNYFNIFCKYINYIYFACFACFIIYLSMEDIFRHSCSMKVIFSFPFQGSKEISWVFLQPLECKEQQNAKSEPRSEEFKIVFLPQELFPDTVLLLIYLCVYWFLGLEPCEVASLHLL